MAQQQGKTRIDELALFGGPPTFEEKLHVGRPNIGNRERFLERINDLLDRRWLTNQGPYVEQFEKQVADVLDARHCIAMCNGTVALEIAIRAVGLAGEVIVPSFTFVATPHALQWQDIVPVFCDVDPATHNIDPARLEELITPRTTGIIGVHLWGRPCDVEAVEEVASRHNLKVLYDAAHAFGCSHQGRMVGHFGSAEVFSFHATKFFNTLEGGAVVTNDDDLADRIRLMKNFGFSGYDTVVHIGTNGKMDEASAAMGLTSLESFADIVATNLRNYARYREELAGIPGISPITYDEDQRQNYQYVVVEVDESEAGISRDDLMDVLWAENVVARRYFYPGCHRMEPYRSYYPHSRHWLPETEKLVKRVLVLPTGTAIEPSDVSQICQIVRTVIAHAEEVTRKLQAERSQDSTTSASQTGGAA